MMSKLCAINDEISCKTYEEINEIKQKGITNIEFRSLDSSYLHNVSNNTILSVLELWKYMGLNIVAIDTPIGKNTFQQVSDSVFERYIEIAEMSQCKMLRLFSNLAGADIIESSNLMRKYALECQKKDICILVETEYGTLAETPEKCVKFIRQVDASNVWMLFDAGNSLRNCQDILQNYKLYRDYIKHIHLSDYCRAIEQFVTPGLGDVPLRALLKVLEQDYKDYITIEMHMKYSDVPDALVMPKAECS